MNDEYTNHLGPAIRERLNKRRISARRAAIDIGMSPAHLSEIISGEKKPGAETVARIAKYFDVPVLVWFEMMGWVTLQESSNLGAKNLVEQLVMDEDFMQFTQMYVGMSRRDRKLMVGLVKLMKEIGEQE